MGIVPNDRVSTEGGQLHSYLREHLTSRLRLLGVIELPNALFMPTTMIPTSLLSLAVIPGERTNLVAFAAPSSRGDIVELDQQPWFHDYLQGLKGNPMTLGFLTELVPGRPWTAGAQHPDSRAIEERLERAFGTVALQDICEVIQGFRHPPEEITLESGEHVVRGRDLTTESLGKDRLSRFKLELDIPERVRIRPGDILVQRIGAKPQLVVATNELEGVVAGNTVFILRPRDARIDSTVIAEFLRSSIGQQLLVSRARTVTAPTLSLAGLRSVPIPIPKEDISGDLKAIREIEEALRTRADALTVMRLGLFAVEHADQFKERVAELRHSARSIAFGLEQFETLNYRIRTLYPYPVSYRYRTLTSIIASSERYREQVKFAEVVLAFLASLSLAILDSSDRSSVRTLFFDSLQRGMAAGSLVEITRTIGRSLANYEDNNLALSLSMLWRSRHSGFTNLANQIVAARNDLHHDRGPSSEAEFHQAVLGMDVILEQLLENMAFLVNHPIRLIRDIDRIRHSRRVILTTLRLDGDHPGLPQERMEYDEALTRNDLYVELRPGTLHPLYPFIVSRDCPRCGSREVFFVERWRGSGQPALLKSFERGHEERDVEIGNELAELSEL
jgi:hypothetical protein